MASLGTTLLRHFGRVRRHGPFMVASVGLLGLFQWLDRDAGVLKGATEAGGSFLQAFVGIYGLVLAFAVFVTWGQHNDTQVAVEKEAVLVGELYRIFSWFDRWPAREAARQHLRDYAHGVAQTYAHGHPAGTLPEREHLEKIFRALLEHRALSPAEERLWDKALDLLHELSQTLEHRITYAGLKLPWGMRWFVILGGSATVVSFALLSFTPFGVHVLFQALLTWVVVAAVTIMLDLDDPYTGDFVVDWSRFEQAAERMECLACPEHLADPAEPADEEEAAPLRKVGP